MIHPDLIEPTAQRGYELFRGKFPSEPTWNALPERTRQTWRDRVKDCWTALTAGRVPANVQETACFLALDELPKEVEQDWREKRTDFTTGGIFEQPAADAVVKALKDEGGADAKRRK